MSIWGETITLDFPAIQKKCVASNKNQKLKKDLKAKSPVNPELEREQNEQALAEGKKTSMLDRGILPLSSFGSSGLKF